MHAQNSAIRREKGFKSETCFLADGIIDRMRVSYQREWVPSIRHPSWDYRLPGTYFITICTEGRAPWFGEIHNGIMGLSPAGCIVAQSWQSIARLRPYVQLNEWIVMPNHIHGIICIRDGMEWVDARDGNTDHVDAGGVDACHVDACHVDACQWHASTDTSGVTDVLRASTHIKCIAFNTSTNIGSIVRLCRLPPRSVGSIINQFKSACTKRIRSEGYGDFAWQPRFYDRIVRDQRALNAIRRYIKNNPSVWNSATEINKIRKSDTYKAARFIIKA